MPWQGAEQLTGGAKLNRPGGQGAPQVYVQRALPDDRQGINAAVEALLQQLPAAGRLGPESRVLLKVNLLAPHSPARAVTTHPDVLRAVILALQARGVKDILVGDNPGGPVTRANLAKSYDTCGFAEVCAETGARLYAEAGADAVELVVNGKQVRSFHVMRPVQSYDFIINLPKFKTHVLTGMSGAVKNLFGVIPGLEKAEYHMRFPQPERFGNMLVDLCELVRADIHIMDGIIAMEGDGPAGGSPRELGLLLAGENPYTLDAAMHWYAGINPARSSYMAAALERGLWQAPFAPDLLVGEQEAKVPLPDFQPPRSYTGDFNFGQRFPRFMQPMVRRVTNWAAPRPQIQKQACIGCGKCAAICPEKVIDIRDKKANIRHKNCIRCFCCHEICPVKAVEVHRRGLFRIGARGGKEGQ